MKNLFAKLSSKTLLFSVLHCEQKASLVVTLAGRSNLFRKNRKRSRKTAIEFTLVIKDTLEYFRIFNFLLFFLFFSLFI